MSTSGPSEPRRAGPGLTAPAGRGALLAAAALLLALSIPAAACRPADDGSPESPAAADGASAVADPVADGAETVDPAPPRTASAAGLPLARAETPGVTPTGPAPWPALSREPGVLHGRYHFTLHEGRLPEEPQRRRILSDWRGAWEEWILTRHGNGTRSLSVQLRRPESHQRGRIERRDLSTGRLLGALVDRRAEAVVVRGRFSADALGFTAFLDSSLRRERAGRTVGPDYAFLTHSVIADGLDLARRPVPPSGLIRPVWVLPPTGASLRGRFRLVRLEDRGETRVGLPFGQKTARHLVWRFADGEGADGYPRHLYVSKEGVPLMVRWPGVEAMLVELAAGPPTLP